jgi:hypothetical protein
MLVVAFISTIILIFLAGIVLLFGRLFKYLVNRYSASTSRRTKQLYLIGILLWLLFFLWVLFIW